MPVARINCRVRADKWWLVRTITEKQQKQSEEARYHRCNACAARGGPLLSCGAHSPMPRRISEVYGGCQSSWMLAGTRRSFRRRNDVVIFLFPLLPSASSFFPRCFSPRLAILLGIFVNVHRARSCVLLRVNFTRAKHYVWFKALFAMPRHFIKEYRRDKMVERGCFCDLGCWKVDGCCLLKIHVQSVVLTLANLYERSW